MEELEKKVALMELKIVDLQNENAELKRLANTNSSATRNTNSNNQNASTGAKKANNSKRQIAHNYEQQNQVKKFASELQVSQQKLACPNIATTSETIQLVSQ